MSLHFSPAKDLEQSTVISAGSYKHTIAIFLKKKHLKLHLYTCTFGQLFLDNIHNLLVIF